MNVGGTDPLLVHRARFPTLAHTLHFASHTLGAMPAEVEGELAAYAARWSERGVRAWDEGWMQLPRDVAAAVERLIRAAEGSVSLHPNVTVAQAVALSAMHFTSGRDRVVCTAEDFPSVLYLYEGLTERGATLTRVDPRPDHRIEAADVVAAIDERTALVALSHVLFRSAQVVDLAPIVRRAHEVGAWVMVDAYQSVGTLEVDAAALGVEVMTGGSIKWLCGGPGTGWLYVRPDTHASWRPRLTGWMAHEQPFAFDPQAQRLDAGPRRFSNGTPCLPAYAAARPGFTLLAEIGGAALRAKSLRQTARLIALADDAGLPVVSPRGDAERGGTVCLGLPEAERVCHRLLAEDVLLDHRPGVGLRLAPHFYTRDDELDEVIRRIAAAART